MKGVTTVDIISKAIELIKLSDLSEQDKHFNIEILNKRDKEAHSRADFVLFVFGSDR